MDSDQLTYLEDTFVCMDVGGLDAIIQAMATQKDSPRIQEEGARLMTSIIQNDEATVEDVGLKGGLFLVTRAMTQFLSDKGVQTMCCRALWILSNNDAHIRWYIDNNLAEKVMMSMDEHMDSMDVQSYGGELVSLLISYIS